MRDAIGGPSSVVAASSISHCVAPSAAAPQQIERSGYAGEARGYLYQIATEAAAVVALEDIFTRSPVPRVVAMPIGFVDVNQQSVDPLCTGLSPLGTTVNTLFQSGILIVASAGNTGHSSSSDCTVLSPATATAAFAVGAHGNGPGTETDVRNQIIYTPSARGGTTTEGRRTIIDITAYAHRSKLFDRTGTYLNFSSGTSIAGPTIAAAAIDFIDFYKTKNAGNTLIDSPGILAVNLLLMGDRQTESGGKQTIHFNNLWGAGRLAMRKFDDAGMDAPWYYETNWTCISHGETHTITLNGGMPIDSAANDFKAVFYWYDRRHPTTGTLDDVDIELVGPGLLVTSSSHVDDKERVFSAQIGGKTASLKIRGLNVTSDNEGCGTDSNKVYWAFFYEDDARNDADGPLSTVIFPE